MLINDDMQITGHYDYYRFAAIGFYCLNLVDFSKFNKMNGYETKTKESPYTRVNDDPLALILSLHTRQRHSLNPLLLLLSLVKQKY
jgi:hypothetical protein